MNNFIYFIKKNKWILIAAVLIAGLAAIVAAVVLARRSAADSAWTSYYENGDYPVSVAEKGEVLQVRLDGSASSGLRWTYHSKAEDIANVMEVKPEEDDKLTVEIVALEEGYATVEFVREGTIGDETYTAARVAIEVVVGADEEGVMRIGFSDIREESSSVGATDTDAPYLINGDTILFPNGGSYELKELDEEGNASEEEKVDIYQSVNDDGVAYIRVSMDFMSFISEDGIMEDPDPVVHLLLTNEELGVSDQLKCKLANGNCKLAREEQSSKK